MTDTSTADTTSGTPSTDREQAPDGEQAPAGEQAPTGKQAPAGERAPGEQPTDVDRVSSTLATIDWRETTFDLYRRVRETADPETAHALWRECRDALFAEHPASPLLPEDAAVFETLPVPTYDPRWRFTVPIEDAEPAHMDVPTGTDGIVAFDRIGLVRIPAVGTLDVWAHGGYAGGIFVPVKDASAGKARGTYGGGRYLLDTIKGADLGGQDRELVIDFNFAYNPSCAYDPAWACPLAPPGNTVAVPIPVGEHYDF